MDSQTNTDPNLNGDAERLDHTDEDAAGEEEEEEDEPSYKSSQPMTGDGASPGKIFIGGLARETTSAQFIKHFGKYGEIIDSVIMKDRKTGQPRGFGFVTYADPSVVDKVIQDSHIINGKQVEIKRTIPRGASGSKDFKTRKIFVGGIPTAMNEDEFKEFFSEYGVVKEHQIMRDHATSRSRGFGFVTFETEQAVDDLLSKGTKIEMLGSQVEIKKAEPKKPNAMPAPTSRYSSSRPTFGYPDSYEDYSSGYRLSGPYGGRHGGAGGYGGPIRGYDEYPGNDFGGGGYGGGGYGPGVAGGAFGSYRGEPPVGYSGRYGGGGGAYGGGGRPYDMGGYGGTGHGYAGGYGGGAAGGSGGAGYGGGGGGYDAGLGGGYGSGGGAGGSFYGGGRGGGGGYGGGGGAGNGRYHPYGR